MLRSADVGVLSLLIRSMNNE